MLLIQSIWILATVYLIVYDLFFHFRLVFHRSVEHVHQEPVSLVICAKNEEENLRENLSLILNQDHEHFEVIVVDDASADGTAMVLKDAQKKFSNLRVISIPRDDPRADLPGKKAALGLGIAAASYDIILLTDADCRPQSEHWVSGMSARFDKSNLVLGYSPFHNTRGLAGYLSAWDNLETAMQYFGFALAGYPYMGVGRNLAYRRNLYRRNRPLGHEAGLASGDDDLQVGAMARAESTSIEISENCRTSSPAVKSFTSWWSQKRRHLSTSPYYEKPVRHLLGAYGVSKLLFYALLPLLLIHGFTHFIVTVLIGRILLHYVSLILNATRLQQWKIIWLFPLWECCNTLFQAIIHFQNLVKPRTQTWS